MKRTTIALSLIATAMLGTTGCTAVVVADEPQATVTLAPQAGPASSAPTSTTAPSATPTEQAPEASAPRTPSEQPTEQVEITPDSSSEAGTTYIQANQRFSPLLDKWVVDGTDVSFTQYNCTGTVAAEGTGTIEMTDSENGAARLTWGETSAGVRGIVGTQLLITDSTLIQQHGISDGVATTDKQGEAAKYAEMCADTAGVVVDIVF